MAPRLPHPALRLLPASLFLALLLLLVPHFSPSAAPPALLAWAQTTAAEVAAAAAATSREVARDQESGFCDRFVRAYGLQCREYQVITSDGYILNIQRITNGSVTPAPITIPVPSTTTTTAAVPSTPTATPSTAATPSDSLTATTSGAAAALGSAATAAADAAARTMNAAGATLFGSSRAAATTQPAAAAGGAGGAATPELPSLPSGRPMLRSQPSSLQRQEAVPTTTTPTLPSFPTLPLFQSQPAASSAPPLSQTRSTQPQAQAQPQVQAQPRAQTQAQTQSQQTRTVPRYPVLLLHAMFLASDLWFAFSNQTGNDPLIAKRVPVGLANRGFDVFLLNHRSTEFSPGHVAYNMRQWQYWDWDFDQLATIDLPATMQLVLSVTGAPKVHLLGFNEGGMLPFALGSTSPHYLSRYTASVASVAPTVFFQNVKSPVLRQWALGPSPDAAVYQAHLLYGAYNVSATEILSGILEAVGYNMLTYFVSTGDPQDLLTNITGPDCCRDRREPPAAPTMGWIATSYRNLIHYQQQIRNGLFQQWDALSNQANMERYGSVSPPMYYLSNMPASVPILVVSGGNDWFADPPNIQKLLSQLQSTSTAAATTGATGATAATGTVGGAGGGGPPVTHFKLPLYSHLDLLLSETAVQDVHPPLIEYLETGYLGA